MLPNGWLFPGIDPVDPLSTRQRKRMCHVAAATAELARRLADGPTLAYGTTKVLLSRELDMDLGSSIELEAFAQALLMTTTDHAEFLEAFTSKRPPEWKGR